MAIPRSFQFGPGGCRTRGKDCLLAIIVRVEGVLEGERMSIIHLVMENLEFTTPNGKLIEGVHFIRNMDITEGYTVSLGEVTIPHWAIGRSQDLKINIENMPVNPETGRMILKVKM